MYYPCSENKDADQLRGYREADLRLCFRPCKLLVFSRTGSTMYGPKSLGVITLVSADESTVQTDKAAFLEGLAKHFNIVLNGPSRTK